MGSKLSYTVVHWYTISLKEVNSLQYLSSPEIVSSGSGSMIWAFIGCRYLQAVPAILGSRPSESGSRFLAAFRWYLALSATLLLWTQGYLHQGSCWICSFAGRDWILAWYLLSLGLFLGGLVRVLGFGDFFVVIFSSFCFSCVCFVFFFAVPLLVSSGSPRPSPLPFHHLPLFRLWNCSFL